MIVLIPTVETPVAGRPVKINFSVKNAGQTPAHEASVFASVEYRDFVNQQPFADPVELSPGFRSELVQDSEIPIVVRTREPCPDDFPAKIASKTSGIFILVEVRYIDDFKKPGIRESRFMYDWRNLREGSNRMFTAVQVGQAPER